LLESSVRDVSELRQVNTTANLDLAKGGSPFNYENYLSLLLAAATYTTKGTTFPTLVALRPSVVPLLPKPSSLTTTTALITTLIYLRPFCTKRMLTTAEQEIKIETARAMSTVNNRISPVRHGINCPRMQRRFSEACLLPRKVKPRLTASQHPHFMPILIL
jgi:hypothetical protein